MSTRRELALADVEQRWRAGSHLDALVQAQVWVQVHAVTVADVCQLLKVSRNSWYKHAEKLGLRALAAERVQQAITPELVERVLAKRALAGGKR